MKKNPQNEQPFELTARALRTALHFPLTAFEIADQMTPGDVKTCGVHCTYTLADLEKMLRSIKTFPGDEKALDAWGRIVFGLLGDLYRRGSKEPAFDETHIVMGHPAPANDATMAWMLFDAVQSTFRLTGGLRMKHLDVDLMLQDISRYRKGQPMQIWRWTISATLALFDRPEEMLEALTPREKEAARTELERLALQEDEPTAMDTLAYACYGGNPLFPCDWDRAQEYLLRLMADKRVDDREKCRYANSLGYIYYYGRCTDGVPEYEKAFRYFSLGAAGGWFESAYKLADLYLRGRGVPQNRYAAAQLIGRVFDDNVRIIAGGNFDCKFADAALRMGNLCRDGIMSGDEKCYYLMAFYAIRKRLPFGRYGDWKVYHAIRRELERLGVEPPDGGSVRVETALPPVSLLRLLDGWAAEVQITAQKRGLKIAVRRLPAPGKEKPEMFFDYEAEADYCELTDRITFTAVGAQPDPKAPAQLFAADDLRIAETENGAVLLLLHHGYAAYRLEASSFTRTLRRGPQEEPQEPAGQP